MLEKYGVPSTFAGFQAEATEVLTCKDVTLSYLCIFYVKWKISFFKGWLLKVKFLELNSPLKNGSFIDEYGWT